MKSTSIEANKHEIIILKILNPHLTSCNCFEVYIICTTKTENSAISVPKDAPAAPNLGIHI